VCERGPGIANFLALGRTIAAEKLPGDFVFVATAGHEIGHGGMEVFLKRGAPSPQDTLAWVHFGASTPALPGARDRKALPPSGRSTLPFATWC
jgi:hypothetical protein